MGRWSSGRDPVIRISKTLLGDSAAQPERGITGGGSASPFTTFSGFLTRDERAGVSEHVGETGDDGTEHPREKQSLCPCVFNGRILPFFWCFSILLLKIITPVVMGLSILALGGIAIFLPAALTHV